VGVIEDVGVTELVVEVVEDMEDVDVLEEVGETDVVLKGVSERVGMAVTDWEGVESTDPVIDAD